MFTLEWTESSNKWRIKASSINALHQDNSWAAECTWKKPNCDDQDHYTFTTMTLRQSGSLKLLSKVTNPFALLLLYKTFRPSSLQISSQFSLKCNFVYSFSYLEHLESICSLFETLLYYHYQVLNSFGEVSLPPSVPSSSPSPSTSQYVHCTCAHVYAYIYYVLANGGEGTSVIALQMLPAFYFETTPLRSIELTN